MYTRDGGNPLYHISKYATDFSSENDPTTSINIPNKNVCRQTVSDDSNVVDAEFVSLGNKKHMTCKNLRH